MNKKLVLLLFLPLFGCTRHSMSEPNIGVSDNSTEIVGKNINREKYINDIEIDFSRNDENHFTIMNLWYIRGPERERIKSIDKNNYGKDAFIVGKEIYYSKNLPDYISKEVEIWKYDVINDVEINLGIKTANGFKISQDGRYVCFTNNTNRKETDWGPIFLPSINLYDNKENKRYGFDLAMTELSEEYGIDVDIFYIPAEKHFSLDFHYDSPVILYRATIDINTKQFTLFTGNSTNQ